MGDITEEITVALLESVCRTIMSAAGNGAGK